MITADDHWPATLQRVVATLHFKVTDSKTVVPAMQIEVRQDINALPALIQTAVKATIELDSWVAMERMEPPINREAVLARKQLARALAADPPGSAQSPFTAGYDAAYRLRLEQLVWAAIADHPRRRLEELASARP
ncbi:hypothetical protein ACN2C6_08050 [Caulobacter sp. ErkDOM-YI]|uniref:hypothetical protein n=1 Tax=unclassified Caulobacter TaxID=2648921 RepID=UPI003AF8F894